MSASLKSGMPGNRDAFAAYLCDETALDVLRPVVIEMGWQPEKCNKGGLRNAIQSLSVSASPAILLVDLSESGDPLNDINSLAEVCEPGTIVIAMGQGHLMAFPCIVVEWILRIHMVSQAAQSAT